MAADILVVGSSHTIALQRAWRHEGGEAIVFVNLSAAQRQGIDCAYPALIAGHRPRLVVSMIGGNFHAAFGLANNPFPFDLFAPDDAPAEGEAVLVLHAMLRARFERGLAPVIQQIAELCAASEVPVVHVLSPPPIRDAQRLLALPGLFADRLQATGVTAAPLRLRFYRLQCAVLRAACDALGVLVLPPPPVAQDDDGYLRVEMAADDPTHANRDYGALVLQQVRALAIGPLPPTIALAPRGAREHPYLGLPDAQFWRHQPAIADPAAFDPVATTSFTIAPDDPVVTAGSCFAQHVARHLAASGFTHLVTEEAHPMFDADLRRRFGYGLFSARYGNVYTTRQLRQLIARAYGEFVPVEDRWVEPDGSLIDPFRPSIQPGGFVGAAEFEADRARHFAAVREAFARMRVFVFTLGLTEAWEDRRDGAVYPVAPGVAGGRSDPAVHAFRNFDVDEVSDDLRWSLERLRAINPDVRFVLTVSPVPLVATYEPRNVWVATTASKAVLRIAAERVARALPLCDYFPSYEIVTSPFARGVYFGPDAREVTVAGVEHVMRCFLRHYGGGEDPARPRPDQRTGVARVHEAAMADMVEVLCDEAAINKG